MDSSRESSSGCGWTFLVLAVVGLCLIPFVGLPIALVLAFAAIVGRLIQQRLENVEASDARPEMPEAEPEVGAEGDDEGRDDGIASPS